MYGQGRVKVMRGRASLLILIPFMMIDGGSIFMLPFRLVREIASRELVSQFHFSAEWNDPVSLGDSCNGNSTLSTRKQQ